MTDVTLNIPDPVQFTCESIIVREQSLSAEHMGIKFILTEKQQAELDALIGKYGYYPTEYIRKYPRIPTSPRIQTYPLQVIAQGIFKDLETPPIVMNIQNLSLGGLLGSSENPFTFRSYLGKSSISTFSPEETFQFKSQYRVPSVA